MGTNASGKKILQKINCLLSLDGAQGVPLMNDRGDSHEATVAVGGQQPSSARRGP